MRFTGKDWSRSDKIGAFTLVGTLLAAGAAIAVVPEFRHALGLDSEASPQSHASSNSQPAPYTRLLNNVPTPYRSTQYVC